MTAAFVLSINMFIAALFAVAFTVVASTNPTVRGARHLRRLIALARAGDRSAVLFIILRSDTKSFSPNEKNDPLFAETLREAISAGVTARALKCDVNKERIRIHGEIPMGIAPLP